MKQSFLTHLHRYGVTHATKLLLAVSGGLDSMVMLHLFHSLKFEVAVAHVNFGLRGSESDADQQFVKNWCAEYQIPFFTTRLETNNYATEQGLSIQMAARELRYQWFDALLLQHRYQFIATAHHLNDSLETALLNLARGGGLEGLTGIAPLSGNRFRPLMFATRAEIEIYAAKNEIAWREDSSNQTDAYQRNLIRHRVIPELKKINPALEMGYASTVLKINHDLAILTAEWQQWCSTYTQSTGAEVKIFKEGVQPATLPHLWRILRTYGFGWEQTESIQQAAVGQPGKIFYSATHSLTVDRAYLIITKLTTPIEAVTLQLSSGKYRTVDQEMAVQVDQVPFIVADQTVAVLDHDKLAHELVWRSWQPGDSFIPLGMNQRKKISDFLVDAKVPLGLKRNVTVLESDGEIAWLVGFRIDNRFKITTNTRKAVVFSITQL
ncbi:MAG: tRNA lysidine(34) synthetase TilS [Cyclobacteriaceae bacterium]|nr:tRNA lysidine(34) synthetase TilS [Cyclobacteriaceae bacterium]